MRRLVSTFTALSFLLLSPVMLPASPAQAQEQDISADADAIAESAGQKWALKAAVNGKYVKVERNYLGTQRFMLAAKTDPSAGIGSWERFTLHTDSAGTRVSLRSEVTGYFATADMNNAGMPGMLRAESVRMFEEQKLGLEEQSDGTFALKTSSGTYVSVRKDGTDPGQADNYDGVLKAHAASVGLWEKFTLEKVAGTVGVPGDVPVRAPGTAAGSLDVMSWNVCANNNTNCGFSHTGKTKLTDELGKRLRARAQKPEVIFLQEFCEKHAKPVEEMLNTLPGQKWKVRFAPIQFNAAGNKSGSVPAKVQKQCAVAGPDGAKMDRGSYGIALAVPAESTWYRSYDLPSVATIVKDGQTRAVEQRTALCATLPSRALLVCNAHFSAGAGYDDDANATWRSQQVAKMLSIVGQSARGYRSVFGGDFNLVPPGALPGEVYPGENRQDVLTPVYDDYLECAQLGSTSAPRRGEPTSGSKKIDYIFAPRTAAFSSCEVAPVGDLDAGKPFSDHRAVHGTVNLPAV